jgi:hypothetical protein
MKITPLTYLCAARIPALTSIFSDAISIASLAVVYGSGGLVTLTASAPHNIPVGTQSGVCVVDAFTPNAIAAWSQFTSDTAVAPAIAGDVQITTTYPHSLTTTPDPTNFNPWDAFANLTGIGISALTGSVQLVDVPDNLDIIVRPSVSVTLPGSIPSGAALLERLERELIGWHIATATSPTALTFPTPPNVTRSYVVANPGVVTNIRVWGAVDFEHALSHFTREEAPLTTAYLFVMPRSQARVSRDRNVTSDAMVEFTPQSDFRMILIDGFELVAILPAERYGGAIACVDACQGPVFTAIMQTFNGLSIPRCELGLNGTDYVAALTDHGCLRYNKANYVHSYRFELIAQLTNLDTVIGTEVPDISALDVAIQNGTPPPADITPFGSVPSNLFDLTVFQNDQPQPLTATIPIPQ